MSRVPGQGGKRCLAGAGASSIPIVLMIALYVLAVGTEAGRRLDGAALRTFHDERLDIPAQALMRWINPISASAVGVALVLAAHRRAGGRTAVAVAVLLAGSVLSAVAFETGLGALDPLGGEHRRELGAAFFPSGHATVAMAVVLAGTIAIDSQLAAASVAAAGTAGVAILLAAAHLPSDVLAGFLLAGAWGAAVVPALDPAERRRVADAEWRGLVVWPLAALTAAAALLGAGAAATTAAIAAAAFAAMAVLRRASAT